MPVWADPEAYQVSWADRVAVRLSGPMRRRAALAVDPAWPVLGDPARGRALLDRHAGTGGTIWQGTGAGVALRQSFAFLDDLAAEARPEAHRAACRWVGQWLTLQGNGRGPGWSLPVAAARLECLTRHAGWLCAGPDGLPRARLERGLARHLRFALRRLGAVPPGLSGLVCLAQLVASGAVLTGGAALQQRAQIRLERLIPSQIGAEGQVADRCPESLAQVFVALGLAARALDLAGQGPLEEHRAALQRMAPVLRALRLGDGSLARFHGGGAGQAAALDAVLSRAPARPPASAAQQMGFMRLARGPCVVIADMAPPPLRVPGAAAHASTLAFEMSVGRHPLLVNCGAGAAFGVEWQFAARRSASHNTLIVDRHSSAPLERRAAAKAGDVETELSDTLPAPHAVGAHNGYVAAFGLIHVRRLDLDIAGDLLRGEDLLSAVTEAEQRQFRKAAGAEGVPFALRFHLHPDVSAHLDAGAGTVRLDLPGGAPWIFRHDGALTLRLDASVYLDNTRAEPWASRQIVLEGRARDFATTVRWSLGREAALPADPGTPPQGEASAAPGPGQH